MFSSLFLPFWPVQQRGTAEDCYALSGARWLFPHVITVQNNAQKQTRCGAFTILMRLHLFNNRIQSGFHKNSGQNVKMRYLVRRPHLYKEQLRSRRPLSEESRNISSRQVLKGSSGSFARNKMAGKRGPTPQDINTWR